jgi:hypothetical protein
MRRRCTRFSGVSLVLAAACTRAAGPDDAVVEPPPAPIVTAVVPAEAPAAVPATTTVAEPAKRGPAPALPEGDTVRVADLVSALDTIAVTLEQEPTVRADFDALRESFELPDDPELFRDYVRVKLVFESARDGGLWQLRWSITNEEPNSDRIWSQWRERSDWGPDDARASATAECDELSALFAFLVRKLGVEDVGLFWPVWNHVVAVWTVTDERGTPVRIVVPTSQIFLDADASLGTRGFDPRKQKTIYEYRRRDAKPELELPAALARFFVERSWAEAHRPQAELQRARNDRSSRLGGS